LMQSGAQALGVLKALLGESPCSLI
jgi:hypothetical protein